MNKDVEKIRAEVKRRREIHRKAKRIESAFEDNAILCYIDSMQEEPISEDLEVIAREYAGIPCDAPKDLAYCVHDKKAKYDAVLFGANWQKEKDKSKVLTEEQCRKIRDDAFELGKDAMKQQIKKSMDLGEPPYLISVEQAYYRTLKLLEE